MTNKIRVFNDDELKNLLKNPNIIGIKNKSTIIYNNEFKYWAVLQKKMYPEKTAREIFESAGFDTSILSESTPQKRLLDWRKKYQKFGEDYFKNNTSFYKSLKKSNTGLTIQEIIILLERKR